ncbi:pyrimidine 5-nucleotidase [Nadsonia fulvescens var. elongata DSM 6958]|uniref:Pyrimidine 5-nucleotidase n=1 Tax=Nadsonia fulvescens var. elongata DSM 6958 TaxID=857566 RepID=A0A1E3PLD9_9ASCO|nr:pyrimidine 5-nucleotidase [Nadsonia fulvescens var. elongata DSM 6958]
MTILPPANFSPSEDADIYFFFDIDNCLYSRSTLILEMMQQQIRAYFCNTLSVTEDEAEELHRTYYREYGLAIEGLVRNHKIDPLDYNSKVDDALPLEKVLSHDQRLRDMLLRLDRTKVKKLWLFTNAYVNHGKRCVELLGISDLFDGITFCDYGSFPLVCKPKKEAYESAMKQSGATDKSKCYFVDDSGINVESAKDFGWEQVVHLKEDQPEFSRTAHGKYQGYVPHGDTKENVHQISSIYDLEFAVPEVFIS